MVTYVVRISVDPTDVQLLPSMTAIVTIITQSAPNAIEVPNAAEGNEIITYPGTVGTEPQRHLGVRREIAGKEYPRHILAG